MARIPIAAALEVIALLFKTVVKFADQAGVTKEQVEEAYRRELEGFRHRDPSKLPDV